MRVSHVPCRRERRSEWEWAGGAEWSGGGFSTVFVSGRWGTVPASQHTYIYLLIDMHIKGTCMREEGGMAGSEGVKSDGRKHERRSEWHVPWNR